MTSILTIYVNKYCKNPYCWNAGDIRECWRGEETLTASILYDLENDLFYERDDKEIFEVKLFVK